MATPAMTMATQTKLAALPSSQHLVNSPDVLSCMRLASSTQKAMRLATAHSFFNASHGLRASIALRWGLRPRSTVSLSTGSKHGSLRGPVVERKPLHQVQTLYCSQTLVDALTGMARELDHLSLTLHRGRRDHTSNTGRVIQLLSMVLFSPVSPGLSVVIVRNKDTNQ